MEDALVEAVKSVTEFRTSEVRIYNGEKEPVKIITFTDSGPDDMFVELFEEKEARRTIIRY